jgi:hypothetical protein
MLKPVASINYIPDASHIDHDQFQSSEKLPHTESVNKMRVTKLLEAANSQKNIKIQPQRSLNIK